MMRSDIFKIIENELIERNIKIKGALYFDCNPTDTKMTIYDMDMTTFKRKKIADYLVPFEKLILA